MIKAVLQAIPTYVMGCFKLPKYLLKEIQSMISNYWWGEGENKKIHWVKWDKMCDSKRDGGMGFRDLSSFNTAMLGKQLWRIIQFPDSLLSHVYKAKYFPRCDVLEATYKSNASFTWKSICGAMELVSHGIRWRVGDGRNIYIWSDNWIPRDYALKPFTPDLVLLGDTPVWFLFNNDGKSWNETIIRSLFWEQDVSAILQIPLAASPLSDLRVWHYTKSGLYSVSSAYHLHRWLKCRTHRQVSGSTSFVSHDSVEWIWKLEVPNKIKIFFWRLYFDVLPSDVNLQSRGVDIDITCVVCGCGSDTALHTFLHCPFARCLWATSPLMFPLSSAAAVSIRSWICIVHSVMPKDSFALFAVSCWFIWTNRNRLIYENAGMAPLEVVEWANSYFQCYLAAKTAFSCRQTTQQEAQVDWSPPPADWVKINFDASIKTLVPGCSLQLGVVIRNSDGHVLRWCRRFLPYIQNPEVAEAMAARLALALACEGHWLKVIVEGDCLRIISQLHQSNESFSESGGILQDIKLLCLGFEDFSFHFVRRTGNKLAHALAVEISDDCLGYDELPMMNPDVLVD